MLSIEQQSTSSKQMLRLVDKDRLIVQRVRVKPHEKLISKTTQESKPQENLSENLWDLSNDYDAYQNSNDDLLDLGNSQMSAFFREFTEKNIWKEEKKSFPNNYKSVKGSGFYYCDSCPFICLNVKSFMEHNSKDHNFHHAPLKSLLKTKCIGCENIFYSVNVLRCHLIEDHDVLSIEVDELIQLVISANKDDSVYMNDDVSQIQTENNYLVDLNDTMFNTTEFDQRSYFVDTQNQIAGENNFIVDDGHLNESFDDFWDNQEQIFNGLLQENNSNNDTTIIEKRLRCTFGSCKVRFTTEDNLKYHEKCHFENRFQCIEFDCQFTDMKWLSMMSHLWKTHKIDIEMFSCNQCEFKTNSLYKLNTFHKSIHKQEKSFLCPECNKGFKSIKQLRNHKVIHTKIEKPPRTDLTCLHCSRNFSSKSLLHQHITCVHIRARPYSCNVCSYTTALVSSLKLHMRSHTGEKPFKCDECGFSTADHNSLRKHKMRHTGQKNYTCPLCNYSCIQASSYKKHLKNKHPGMDDGFLYSCDMCNFKTIRKDIYMLHIVKHKEETIQNYGICEPLVPLDEIFNEKEKIQSEIAEQSYLFNTIRVKPLNSMKCNEIITNI